MQSFLSQRNKLISISVLLVVSFSNFWIYWIYEKNFFLGESIIIETVLLFLLVINNFTKVISALILIILLMTSIYLLTNYFDKEISSPSTIESIKIRQRRQFYAPELGKIYTNRFGIYYFDNLRLIFNKLSSNFFSNMDLSVYFSPRTLIDREKYALFLSPLFIFGFLSVLGKLKAILFIYLLPAMFVSSLLELDSTLHPLLMLPFMSLCITIGLIKLMKVLKDLVIKKL